MEDSNQLMAEEMAHAMQLAQDTFVEQTIRGSPGDRSSTIRKPPKKKLPPKSVETCLDGLDELMRGNGGRLPVDCINEMRGK